MSRPRNSLAMSPELKLRFMNTTEINNNGSTSEDYVD